MKCNKLIIGTFTLSAACFSVSTHAFDALSSFSQAVGAVAGAATQQTAAQPKVANQAARLKAGVDSKREVIYEGYTKDMLAIKKMISSGEIGEAIKARQQGNKDPDKFDLLTNLELGLMSLDAEDVKSAQGNFSSAERLQVGKEDQSTVSSFFSSIGSTTISTISGNAELGDYPGVGFERVLMLNYKSIAYLLEGDRNAYNVTRRAIDLQNMEKKAFEEKIRDAKKEIAEQEKEQKEKGAELNKVGFGSLVKKQYKSSDKKASKVASAFVNPFGFYIAGVVQELDSYEDKSLRDNARISYKKALKLNPKSDVIKQAIRDIKKPAPKGRRLVHVIVGDGFAPEKKLLKFDLSLGFGPPTHIELPIYEAVDSQVHRIEVQTSTGKRWARLSEVADITALALRHQKEAGPLQQLSMMTTVIRNVIEGHAWNQATQSAGVFGSLVSSVKDERDKMVHPDTRSWATLPSRLMAARFYVPKSVSRIKISAYNRKGKRLSTKMVNIDKNSHNIVYARTLNNTLYTASSDTMWVKVR